MPFAIAGASASSPSRHLASGATTVWLTPFSLPSWRPIGSGISGGGERSGVFPVTVYYSRNRFQPTPLWWLAPGPWFVGLPMNMYAGDPDLAACCAFAASSCRFWTANYSPGVPQAANSSAMNSALMITRKCIFASTAARIVRLTSLLVRKARDRSGGDR